MRLPFRLFLVVASFALASVAFAQQSNPRIREISQVAGDLYKVTDGDKATVFVVGETSILLADPLSAEFVRWLRLRLDERFPGRQIRYVVHTSHRYERAAGSGGLAKDAEIIGHEAVSSLRRTAAQSLPPSWAVFDRNQNNVLERSEIAALSSEEASKDLNTDGLITAGEAWSDVSGVEATYTRRRMIEFDGRRVELIHPGDGLGADLTLLLFPKERVLFAPGVPLRETPTAFAPSSPGAFIDTLRQIERIEFDTVLSGAGEVHTLSDVTAVREYTEAVVNGVKGGIRAGRDVEQLQASLDLQQFSYLRGFDVQRARNIEEVYRRLHVTAVGVSGAAQFTHLQRGVPDCALNAVPTFVVDCEGVGGPTMAGTASADVMVGRIGAAFEIARSGVVRGSDQRFISPATRFESREMVMAYMFRYQAGRFLGLRNVLTGGYARVTVTQQVDGPNNFFFGITDYETKTSEITPVFGVDLTLSKRPFKMLVPIRVARESAQLFTAVGSNGPKWSFRAGIGIGANVASVLR